MGTGCEGAACVGTAVTAAAGIGGGRTGASAMPGAAANAVDRSKLSRGRNMMGEYLCGESFKSTDVGCTTVVTKSLIEREMGVVHPVAFECRIDAVEGPDVGDGAYAHPKHHVVAHDDLAVGAAA